MSEFIVTFGYGHDDERHGSLRNCVTRVEAPSALDARIAIVAIRGQKWHHIYSKEDGEEMIAEFSLREIPLVEIDPQVGDNL